MGVVDRYDGPISARASTCLPDTHHMEGSDGRRAAVCRAQHLERNHLGGSSDAEKAAMRERARELKAEARAGKKRSAGERDVLEKIAELPEHDRILAERFHAIVTAAAPVLWP